MNLTFDSGNAVENVSATHLSYIVELHGMNHRICMTQTSFRSADKKIINKCVICLLIKKVATTVVICLFILTMESLVTL